MTLGSHQRTIGVSQAHITPRFILTALGPFDLDPAAADPRPWNCAARNYTERHDGLSRPWRGRVWLNPPFDRRIVAQWIERMASHGWGTALVHVRTETAWFRPIWESAAGLLFLSGRIIFHKPDGSLATISNPSSKHFGKNANSGAPVCLVAFGHRDLDVLGGCDLAGAFVPLRFPHGVLIATIERPDDATSWRELVLDWLRQQRGPVAVADLYRAFASHPKARGNRHVREKLRQTLQRGSGRRLGRDQWVAAA